MSQKLPEYVTGSVEKEHLNNFEGKEHIKDSTAYTVGNSFKVSGEAESYIGGGAAVGSGILKATQLLLKLPRQLHVLLLELVRLD